MPENHIDGFNTMELISNKTCYKGTGLTDDDLARPIIGIACSYNDSVPGHTNLQQLAEQVKFRRLPCRAARRWSSASSPAATACPTTTTAPTTACPLGTTLPTPLRSRAAPTALTA